MSTGSQFFVPMPNRGRPAGEFRRRLADAIDPARRQHLEELLLDPLTELYNEYSWTRARDRIDQDDDIEVVTADVIGLKALNDTRGHEAGNRMLRVVASMIRRVAGQLGVDPRGLFRSGGDEFVVAVPRGRGREFAQRLAREVPLRDIRGTHFQTGVRYGVGPTFLEADRAMTEARLHEDVRHYREVIPSKEAG